VGSDPVEIPVAPWVAALAFGEGGLWATSEIADEVHRIDPRTNHAALVRRAPAPRAIDAGDRSVWVTVAEQPSADASLPEGLCTPVHFDGSGEPDLLITSSLSMEGHARAFTGPLVDGVKFVLEQRGFEAGPHRVGFQACDTATAQAGNTDFFRCGSNAKALARNLKVVGVIGAWESFCSELEIPIANDAPGGPLAMISPSNTGVSVTTDGGLYPSGIRNYVRIASMELYQGTAQIKLLEGLDASSAFLLTATDSVYDDSFPDEIRDAAGASDIRLVGDQMFDRTELDPGSLAADVARAEPGAVIIVGMPDVETGALIRALRAALDSGTPIVLPDTFAAPEDLIELAGPAAQGLYVTVYGIPNSKLPPPGQAFLKDFERWRGAPAGPDLGAAYGAQAAEILLDAIGRSDGTRESVTKEMFATHIVDGILGPISFDEKGDLIEGPHTVLRLVGDDFEVDRVVMSGEAATGS
jgi:branched-chain amino acid transport system substrate-binding protein